MASRPVKAAIKAPSTEPSIAGMSPSRISAPSLSGGKALKPAFSELLKPSSKAALWTMVTLSSPNAAATRGASKPVTTMTGSAPLLSAAPATCATIGLSLDRLEQLVARAHAGGTPAASTIAAIFAAHFAAPACRVAPR